MAKGKNLNPADAYRKALRKKELKKNKAERTKAREFALVKKDTRELEEDIERLEATAELSAVDRARLTDLKSELEDINNKKEEYVKEHPEHRKLVYRARRNNEQETIKEQVIPQKRNVFKKNGLPRHPERSIYYDPVMNPYGVAPPGMPYIERPLLSGEIESDDEDNDEDDDIVMPEGPPPGTRLPHEAIDSDDDIPMPEGPPPEESSSVLAESQYSPLSHYMPPGFPTMGFPNPAQLPLSVIPVPLSTGQPPLPPDPPPAFLPPPPGSMSLSFVPGVPTGYFVPPPPSQAYMGLPHPPPCHPLPPLPPPPPGFFPRRQQSMSAMQDPLSSVPHETFQAHRARRLAPSSLPPNTTLAASTTTLNPSTSLAAATVTAEPQLRDLKKEATAFIPTSLKRKKLAASSTKVNSAPSLGPETANSESVPDLSRPDLLGTLRNQFGPSTASSANSRENDKAGPVAAKPKDDYQKFVEEMGDLLGSAK